MDSDLTQKLEDLEIVRRRAGRRTLLILIVGIVAGGVSAGAYVLTNYRRTESAQEKVQEVTREKEKVFGELTAKVEEETKKREQSERRIDQTLQVIKDPSKVGIKAYHEGRYAEAVKAYDKALNKDPNDPYIWNLKGYSLFKAGRYEESIDALRTSVRINPQYAWGYFDLARVYCKVNRREEAIIAARKAVQLRSDMKAIMSRDKEFTSLCGNLVD
jgi:tetratricopeptide (TPR) repeat protein